MLPIRFITADSDARQRALLRDSIESLGLRVQFAGEASDGEEALKLVRREPVDIVLSEIAMRGIGGFELASVISERCPWVKVMIVTADYEPDSVRTALRCGVFDYLPKPLHAEETAAALKRAEARILQEEARRVMRRLDTADNMHPDLAQLWTESLLQDDPEQAVRLLAEAMLPFAEHYVLRPRLMDALLTAWCRRLLERSGLAVEAPFSQIISAVPPFVTVASVKLSLSRWVQHIADQVRRKLANKSWRTVHQIKRYIDGHYAEPLTLEQLARELHFNKTYLANLFKQETAMTIGQYLQDVRMREAGSKLTVTADKIYEIAFKVGYRDVAHFTKMFRKHFGVSPQSYRSIAREDR